MAKEGWISNIVFGKQSWTTQELQVPEDIWGGREGEGSNNHKKCLTLLKKILYQIKIISQENLSARIWADKTKRLHCLQVVKPRGRQSAFSLCETELILHPPGTEEIYILSPKWQGKEHHLKYYTFLWVWFFCWLCLFCLIALLTALLKN